MKGCLIAGGIVLLALLLIGGCAVGAYNGIVGKEERVNSSFTEIKNQYQRRSDVVPQLVETVKGAAAFEKSTITEVTEARASVGRVNLPASVLDDPEKVRQFFQAQEQLSGALARLIAVAENYPELKATENFRDLQTQLEGTENRLATARRDYIESVREYNVSVKRFPGAVVAGLFGFEPHPQLEIPESATERPEIDFDSQK